MVYEHIGCLQCVASVVFAFVMHLYIFYLQCILFFVHGARFPGLIDSTNSTVVLSVEMRGGDVTVNRKAKLELNMLDLFPSRRK